MNHWRRTALALGAASVVAIAMFALGRASVHTPAASPLGDYFDGLRVGQSQGRELGRAQQAGAALPPHDRRVAHDAFRAGYAAGADDVFAGYDGGWALGVPWIVVLEPGGTRIDYRIRDRTPMMPGVAYYLCPDRKSLCHSRR